MKKLFIRIIYKEFGRIKEGHKVIHWEQPITCEDSLAELTKYLEVLFGIEIVSIVNFRRMEDAE